MLREPHFHTSVVASKGLQGVKMLVRSWGDVLRIMSQLLAMLEGGERVASSDRFVSDCVALHSAPRGTFQSTLGLRCGRCW